MFHGSIVALVTPMTSDGSIDRDAILRLVEFHIEQGTDAIVAMGTTGESATLSPEEHLEVVKLVYQCAKGRVPVIAGSGNNCTASTIELTHEVMQMGVDASLLVTPYYNKPTQEGLYQHYKAVADAVPIPIILYNVPGRTGVDLLPETALRLATVPNIIGIKEASGEVTRCETILAGVKNSFDVYSGEDGLTFDLMKLGAKGVISVTANVAPRLMHEMCQAMLNQEVATAEAINQKLMPLHKALFVESNPIPVKWALYKMGMIGDGIRLPLTKLAQPFHDKILKAMHEADIKPNAS